MTALKHYENANPEEWARCKGVEDDSWSTDLNLESIYIFPSADTVLDEEPEEAAEDNELWYVSSDLEVIGKKYKENQIWRRSF